MKFVSNVNLYLKVFSFYLLSVWVKPPIVDINIQGFCKGQKFCFICIIPSGFKVLFFPMENIFFRFVAKFLKVVVISHSLLLLKFEQPYFIEITYLIFKKLGYNFSQFIKIYHNAKLMFLSVALRLNSQNISNSQRDFAIFKYCSSWTSTFLSIHDKDGKLRFFRRQV